MNTETQLAMIMIAVGFIGVPLACWLFCLWFDYSDDYVAKRCRKANRDYFKSERQQKRRRRKK